MLGWGKGVGDEDVHSKADSSLPVTNETPKWAWISFRSLGLSLNPFTELFDYSISKVQTKEQQM